jgi:hypothetical protein
MNIRGQGGATLWKTFWKDKENIRHKFSRARTKNEGFLGVVDNEMHGKGVGFWSIFGDHRCLSFTGMGGI